MTPCAHAVPSLNPQLTWFSTGGPAARADVEGPSIVGTRAVAVRAAYRLQTAIGRALIDKS